MNTPEPHDGNASTVRLHSNASAVQGSPGERFDDQIGRYKLIEKLGEGGCGTVYLAEQSEPVQRRVALKVIKLGMDTKEVIARFEAERQALAMMDHPSIAKVFDAGTTDSGRPYFVMELVQGVPITAFCDEQKLAPARRLALFIQVCHAVQHAHQKGIIHRDIKPSNIMVAMHDGVPLPKVIDFGIAKATAGRLTDNTIHTAVEQFIGTPAYMSPEQAQVSAIDIDTRSDVYSLGVLLYELLTGRTPFDTTKLLKAGLDEMRRYIREVDPPRPSTRLNTLQGDVLSTTAQRRQITAPKLVSLVRGDLDWIVMRCLEKDRTRRYETANGLATDLQRHLAHEPVAAGPPGTAYRLQKLARRHRLAFASGTVVAASLVLGFTISTGQAIRANRAERIARHEAARANTAETSARNEAAIARAVNDFLFEDLLKQADSRAQADARAAPNPDPRLREVLDRAGANVDVRFKDQPIAEAAVRTAIGRIYYGVGDWPKSVLHHKSALGLRKQVLGSEHPDTLTSMSELANAYDAQGEREEAAALHLLALTIQERTLGREHPNTLLAMNKLALRLRAVGQTTQASSLLQKILGIQQRVLGPEHPDTLITMDNLASATNSATEHARTLEMRQRVLGPIHPDTLRSMHNLAGTHLSGSRYAEAATLLSQTLPMRQRVLGAEHPDTLATMRLLARANLAAGRFAEAAPILVELMTIQTRVLGEQHGDTLESKSDLACAYLFWGKLSEAKAVTAQVTAMLKRTRGPEYAFTLKSLTSLAAAYRSQAKHAETVVILAQILDLKRGVLGLDDPSAIAAMTDLASGYERMKDLPKAEAIYREQLAATLRKDGANSSLSTGLRLTLGKNLLSQEKFGEAETVFRNALAARQRRLPLNGVDFEVGGLLGVALAGQKKFIEAESVLHSSYNDIKAHSQMSSTEQRARLKSALVRLVNFYHEWGKPQEAAEWQLQLDAANASPMRTGAKTKKKESSPPQR